MNKDNTLIHNEDEEECLFDILDRNGVYKKSNYTLLKKKEENNEPITITDEMQKNISSLIEYISRNPCEGAFRMSCRSEEINQVLRNLPNLSVDLDPIIAACTLKHIWRNVQSIPRLYYFPILRLLHLSSTVRRVELMRKIMDMIDSKKRILIHQMVIVAAEMADATLTKLDQKGIAVLFGPVLFSQSSRPTIRLNIPLEMEIASQDDKDEGNKEECDQVDDDNFERTLIIKEVDWMIESFYFMIKHEQRIFKNL
jgi:hypothetical protein